MNGSAKILEEGKLVAYAENIARNFRLFYTDRIPAAIYFKNFLDFTKLSEDQKKAVCDQLVREMCHSYRIKQSEYLDSIHVNNRMSEVLHSIYHPTADDNQGRMMLVTKEIMLGRLSEVLLAGAIETEINKYRSHDDVITNTIDIHIKGTLLEFDYRPKQILTTVASLVNSIISFYDLNMVCVRVVTTDTGFRFDLAKTMKVTNYGTYK